MHGCQGNNIYEVKRKKRKIGGGAKKGMHLPPNS